MTHLSDVPSKPSVHTYFKIGVWNLISQLQGQGAFLIYCKHFGHRQIKPNSTTAEVVRCRFIYMESTVPEKSYGLDPDSFSKTLKLRRLFVKNLEQSPLAKKRYKHDKIMKPLTSLSSVVLSASLMFMLYKKNWTHKIANAT